MSLADAANRESAERNPTGVPGKVPPPGDNNPPPSNPPKGNANGYPGGSNGPTRGAGGYGGGGGDGDGGDDDRGVAITAVKMAIIGMGGEIADGMVQHTHMTTMTIPGHHPGKMTMTMT